WPVPSSCSLARRADDHVTTRRTRHGAAHRDQAALGVDLHHLKALGALADGTHVACHLLAREHAARRLPLAQRTGRTMRQRVAVGRVAHGEVPALDRALETLALGHALDVDHLADLEDVGADLATELEVGQLAVLDPELPQATAGFDLGLGQVPGLRLVEQRSAAHAGSHLDRGVAVDLDGLDLGNAVGSRLDQRHGDRLAVLGEVPAHAGLAADDAQRVLLRRHGAGPQVSLIWTSTPAASSSFISASTVLSLGSTMSSTRLCVRVSYWSRASLSTCGETRMV